MCSIAGIYWLDKKFAGIQSINAKVENAVRLLKNRGPDQSSFCRVADNCVMGGNRLIIRGDNEKGVMPFVNSNNVMFYNGEIYNFRSFNENIETDGEIVLPLYEELGNNCFSKLDGEFAISIWDDSNQSIILARDPFGTKPLYFSLDDKCLMWASSASAINEMEKHEYCASTKGPNYYITMSVQEPYTSYKNIWLIPPGHYLVVNKSGAKLYCYNMWNEYTNESDDITELCKILDQSITSRLEHTDVIGIAMSGGIDSGIIAFLANKLDIRFHIFSVVEMFGEKTPETDSILERVKRLKNAEDVTLLKCNTEQFDKALDEVFLPNYYDSEKYDTGIITMHTVMDAMKKAGIRVAIDGTGGDELFHGYTNRDEFRPVDGWPMPWKQNNYFYSLFSSLIDFTAKTDRAGGYFSIETRFPYQNVDLMKAALKLKYSNQLKWPLRKFLLEHLEYGEPTDMDINRKVGFGIGNQDWYTICNLLKKKWCAMNGLNNLPSTPPIKFPFKMGIKPNGLI